MSQFTTTLADPTDQFVASRLPLWLKQASQGQINKLRDCYAAHRASHGKLAKVLHALASPQTFALQAFTGLLSAEAAKLGFDRLEWLEVRRRFTVSSGISLPEDEISYARSPALLRMMQNFPGNEPFYEGSGLVAKGESRLLLGDANDLARRCREADAGKQYQALLSKTVTAEVRKALAEHKRTGFSLALELAALKGDIGGVQQAAVRELANHDPAQQSTKAYAGTLKVLDCDAFDSLLIQLRGSEGEDTGVVLYMPADVKHPLRFFTGMAKLNEGLAADFLAPAMHRRTGELVQLSERTAFVKKLDKRLRDSEPDLELDGQTVAGDVFAVLADAHVKRLRADADMLLVSTAEAERTAAKDRLLRWKGIGMGALGIAGLFVPGLGELLLAQLAVQVTEQTYDGVSDWAQGHQHEAAEHLLGVAEIVAVTAATAAGARGGRARFLAQCLCR